MHDHEHSERLASYADVLASELPDAWTSTYHPPDAKDDLAELTGRIWDLDLIAESLAEHPLQHAAVLSRPDGAQLAVLDRHDERDGFLIAAVAPRALPDEAYRAVPEPNGIALTDERGALAARRSARGRHVRAELEPERGQHDLAGVVGAALAARGDAHRTQGTHRPRERRLPAIPRRGTEQRRRPGLPARRPQRSRQHPLLAARPVGTGAARRHGRAGTRRSRALADLAEGRRGHRAARPGRPRPLLSDAPSSPISGLCWPCPAATVTGTGRSERSGG
ncbi:MULTISPECIES: hypothetical protein [Streptomyces]|uniref:hypothetical protein n=1 Tax=Streptomyces TaxID=1883 RepID=UPI000A80517C